MSERPADSHGSSPTGRQILHPQPNLHRTAAAPDDFLTVTAWAALSQPRPAKPLEIPDLQKLLDNKCLWFEATKFWVIYYAAADTW